MNPQDETRIEGEKPHAPRFEKGDLIDAYRVREFIGAGEFSETYEVEHDILGTVHAIKVLSVGQAGVDPEGFEFRARAEQAAALRHPNIVVTDDFGRDGNLVWLRMELVVGPSTSAAGGCSLKEKLAQVGRMPPEAVASTVAQIAAALAYAHEQGALHLNLKPSNVLLAKENASGEAVVKLVDFFFTEATSPRGHAVSSEYASPEQQKGQGVDARSDVYSLGRLAFHILTGEDVVRLSKPGELVPDLDPIWDSCLERAMARNPEDRYASVREFADALRLEPVGRSQGAAEAPRVESESIVGGIQRRSHKPVSKRKRRALAEAERIEGMNNPTLRTCYMQMKEIKYFILIHIAVFAGLVMSVYTWGQTLGSASEIIDFELVSAGLVSALSIIFAFRRKDWHRPGLIALCLIFLLLAAPDLKFLQESGAALLLGSIGFFYLVGFPIYSATVFYRAHGIFGASAPSYGALEKEFKKRQLKSRVALNGLFCVIVMTTYILTSMMVL